MKRRQFNHRLLAAAVAGCVLPSLARAQAWPSRPISLILPYPPGGNTDFIGRITADWLGKALGHPVIVENRAGAGGTIAAAYAARAPADGHTLFFGTITQISLAQFLYKVRYDPFKDFVPIANVGGNPLVLTVGSSSRFQNLADLIKFGRENPGLLTVGHAGEGSLSHLSAAVFLYRAGIKATMVGYKGGSLALTDMMGGQTDLYSANISEIMPHVSGGRLRFLAVSSLEPIPQLPGVPTIAATIPNHWIETWNGVFGPTGMPAVVVDRIAEEISKMLKDPSVRSRLGNSGVITQDREVKGVFADRIQHDVSMWRPMMERVGIKPE
jgi:tripartite-type tricarboxylate transporter receptor subunit TctC